MNNYLTPEEYLPHDKPMVLLDEVLHVDENTAVTRCIVDSDHVLKPFIEKDGVPTFITLELLAQSVGIWAGYFSIKNGQKKCPLGMVIGGRDYKNQTEFFKTGSVLEIEVKKIMHDDSIGSFEGCIKENGVIVSTGRVNVVKVSEEQFSQLFKR